MRVTEESAYARLRSKTWESICVPQTPLSCRFGHPNMMPKIEASKNESKPVKMGLPITFEPLIYPHDFPKSLFINLGFQYSHHVHADRRRVGIRETGCCW